MKYLVAIIAALMLTGCFGTFETKRDVVTETKYVVRTASAAQKQIPVYPAPIDVQTANQLELAQWIIANEKRQMDLESLIKELISFYEQPVTKEEKK
jgi:PBP1b-binding outer membrane lipoprotein LpoB